MPENIKFEKDGMTKVTQKRFTDDLLAQGWTVVDGSENDEEDKSMTKNDIMAHLRDLGVSFDITKKKADLLELLNSVIDGE